MCDETIEKQYWRKFQAEIWLVLAIGKSTTRWDEFKAEVSGIERAKRILSAIEKLDTIISNRDFGTRFVWLTSMVGGRKYPPLNAEFGGDISWNGQDLSSKPIKEAEKETIIPEILDPWPGGASVAQNQSINDCSFVASLINIRSRAPTSLKMARCKSRLWNFNFHFNGVPNRLVQVDPVAVVDSPHIMSEDPLDWMLENAYMQVKNMSSYAYHGSNAAIDTFLLNGFIPETCSVNGATLGQIIKSFKSSFCLITIGTGELVKDAEFLSNHDYPIIGITEGNLLEIRDVLDPQKVWHLQERALLENFRAVYFNWNSPVLFSHHQTLHFKYDSLQNNASSSTIDKPVFEVCNDSPAVEPVWVLLERHLGSRATESDGCSLGYTSRELLPVQNYRGSNLGFHLLKLDLQPKERKLIFCHSDVSANYSIHFYHVSKHISAHKYDKRLSSMIVKDEWDASNDYGPLSNPCFYMNPTFEVTIQSPEHTTQYLNLQLISVGSRLINAQMFNINDGELSKPLFSDGTYEDKLFCRRAIPLTTNTRYQIVCSSYEGISRSGFRLVVTNPHDSDSITLKRIYPQFGWYKHHNRCDFIWKAKIARIKFDLSSNSTSSMQLRILPLRCDPTLFIRVNIFTTDIKIPIIKNHGFSAVPRYGLIIPDLKLKYNESLTLLLERDGPSSAFEELPLRLELGSDFEITINER
ncbi:LADA_0F00650g1_1 [Lachancea dasiensis]|uniref:Cysteine protease RIM13 n=1 Tax=Lachancea dasiensis TaxID=1072105 RepID=A0A1G4JHX0_9SACH|nr:LADA_0F00650g1_1 [Lachancea dasiensis]